MKLQKPCLKINNRHYKLVWYGLARKYTKTPKSEAASQGGNIF